jgi:hypothetical protein
MLRIIQAILISLIFVSSTTFAQTTTSTTGKFTFLSKGDNAPFTGTLFDPIATAKIVADKKIEKERCESRIKFESSVLKANCKRDTDLLNLEIEIEKKKNKLIMDAQQQEIESLRKLAKGGDNTLWAVIGFVTGSVTSIAIFFAATKIVK